MPRDGTATRERILDSAERLIIDRGFAATTVDAVLADAGTTKGAFFHHFASKAELARSLVDRYAAADIAALDDFMMRAEAESEDPAEQVIAFVRLFEEAAEELAGMQPGCLYVSYIYEKQLFDDGTNDAIIDTVITCARAATRKARGGSQSPPTASPRRSRLARRPGLHHLRRRLHPRTHDARPDTPARTAHPPAPLPPTPVRARADDTLGGTQPRPGPNSDHVREGVG